MASNAENVSIWWRNHEVDEHLPQFNCSIFGPTQITNTIFQAFFVAPANMSVMPARSIIESFFHYQILAKQTLYLGHE